MAQTPPPLIGEPETVYSDAQRQIDLDRSRRVVETMLAPSFSIDNQYARWKRPVCPHVYGLTPAELALWINAHYLSRPCRLSVISMRGWTRPMVWEDTGLKWIATSPNVPTIAAARAYTATGCLGEIGIESGCGGPNPFEVILGSGWDAGALTRHFNALQIPGVRARPWSAGRETGVYLQIDPRNAGNLTAINFQALDILRNDISHFSAFGHARADEQDMFDKVCGNRTLRHQIMSGRSAASLVQSWSGGIARWARERQPYLIYGNSLPHGNHKPSVIAENVDIDR